MGRGAKGKWDVHATAAATAPLCYNTGTNCSRKPNTLRLSSLFLELGSYCELQQIYHACVLDWRFCERTAVEEEEYCNP